MIKHNAYFAYNGRRFDVEVSRLSYSLALKSKGASQSKQGFTIYPYRYEQSPLSVKLIFETPGRYMEFREFVGAYHRDMASRSGILPKMIFAGSDTMDARRGYRPSDGFYYEVVIESAPFQHRYDMVAPEISLQLTILDNGQNMQSTGASSELIGSERDLVTGGSGDSDYLPEVR